MPKPSVACVTLTCLDLETGLDDVAGSRQVCSRHTGNGTGSQELENPEPFGRRLTEKVPLQMAVGGEVDCRKGDVSKQTCTGSFIEARQAEVLNNPHGGALASSVGFLDNLTLNLQADLDDLERIGEHLRRTKVSCGPVTGSGANLQLDRLPHCHRPRSQPKC